MKTKATFHQELLATASLTPQQERFYGNAKAHGFSSDSQDLRLLYPVFVKALYLTLDRDSQQFRNVLLFVPKPMESWVLSAFEKFAKRIGGVRKKHLADAERKPGNADIVKSIQHLQIGSRAFAFNSEPDYWASFGFTKSTVAPEWLKNGLIDA